MITAAPVAAAFERRDDQRAPLGEARDDLALGGERFLVGVGGGDVDVAAAEEAVAAGGAARVEAERGTGTMSAPCSASRRCAGRTNLTVDPSAR